MKELKYCRILDTNINVISMQETVHYITDNIDSLRGNYICVSNVHTTVMSYENKEYNRVQNEAAMALPDGKPLSVVSRKRGFPEARRVTGPDLMGELFYHAKEYPLRHYFYGGTEETIRILDNKLRETYPDLQIAGMYSPPFRALTCGELDEVYKKINETEPDIIWVGLGAPKQENFMYDNRGKFSAVMVGVGAGFDYHAGRIKRAPQWMQKCSLEWLYRLMQDPGRLLKRYVITNFKFIYYIFMENFRGKKH